MFKSTLFVAALAAVALSSMSLQASATDTQTVLNNVGSSSNDSWDRCRDDDRNSSYGRDDRRKCVTKRRDDDRRDGRGGSGNGG